MLEFSRMLQKLTWKYAAKPIVTAMKNAARMPCTVFELRLRTLFRKVHLTTNRSRTRMSIARFTMITAPRL